MRILIACEQSGIVREAFKVKGHNVWSCDLLPSEIPGQHIQGDVLDIITDGWDMMIAHPPCTYLTVAGNKWFKEEFRLRFPGRLQDREAAVKFFMALADAPIKKIAIENPVGIMSTRWKKPDQIIQPYQFGHVEPKKTCLWLKNLPPLLPGLSLFNPELIKEPDYFTTKSGKRLARWYYLDAVKSENRSLVRSRTFTGIAKAMAEQWG